MLQRIGQRVRHRFNADLGLGRVVGVEGRNLVVEFPDAGAVLRVASDNDALQPLQFIPGARARVGRSRKIVVVAEVGADGTVRLTDGRLLREQELWPLEQGESLFDQLAEGRIDPLEDFANRLDALELSRIRRADGLGSFLGGRIRIFPHQLHVAERATRHDPVRWLLADEVGLGKTVEACLILNHLLRTRGIERTLIVVPETLTVQWLGELWRKYHQVFVLLDDKRLGDVRRDYGEEFNPFDAHRQVVLSLELLVQRPRLSEQAVQAGVDLLVVDEAHHLQRPPGHPGNAAYRVVQPIAGLGRHLLLLTATPLEDDAHGFFRLVQLLRPEEFREESFEARLERREPLPPCTSATRREDIGGLPPRRPCPIEIEDQAGWAALARLEQAVGERPAATALAEHRKAEWLERALSTPASLAAVTDPKDPCLPRLVRDAEHADPRVRWLAEQGRRWRDGADKTLVFVAHRESLELLRSSLSRIAQLRVGVFHEDLSPAQRDIEVAQFRLESGPSMLVSTECGGEGRNFEFCHRLVLLDLPWDPMVVEQRIGRLDRIGRDRPVEIVYFRPPRGLGRAVAELYEHLGLFREALGGLERELSGFKEAIRQAALTGAADLDSARFAELVREARRGRDRIRAAAYHELHRQPYAPELGPRILERIPAELEELTEEVIVTAGECLGMNVERQRGAATFSIEFGTHALVESLPGVPGGSNFLGTFDRSEGVEKETLDFFASGHPLVEGILSHLDDSPRGRVALLHLRQTDVADEVFGVAAFHRDGAELRVRAVDLTGRERPELAALLMRRPLRSRRVRSEDWVRQPGWPALIHRLAERLAVPGPLEMVAAFRISPR